MNYLVTIAYSILFSLLGIDSFRNSLKSQEIIGILALKLIIPFLLLQLFLNWKYKITLRPKIKLFLFYFCLPLIFLATFILSILDALSPANFVYSLTNLHQSQLGILMVFLGFSLMANQKREWWIKNIKKIIFFSPFIFVFTMIIVKLWPFDFFLNLVKEDHLIENLQVIFLFIGSLLTGFLAFQFRKNNNYLFYFFITICLSLIFIAGDEISWGQRIFHFKTLKIIASYNLQNENTVHNLSQFSNLIGLGYFIISFIGLFGRKILMFIFPKLTTINNWFPDKYFIGYFIFPAVYNGFTLFRPYGFLGEWSEPIELILYCGLIFWFIYRGWQEKNKFIL